MTLDVRARLWYQHDGAPAHNSQLAKEAISNRWIGRGGTILWPPRSPDLNPLDFFLWGHMKNYVYSETVNTIEDLEDRIQEAVASVTPEMLNDVQRSMLRRARVCIQNGGRHFEHLL